jgi:hypothetical protein
MLQVPAGYVRPASYVSCDAAGPPCRLPLTTEAEHDAPPLKLDQAQN